MPKGRAKDMTKLSWDQVLAFRLERQFVRSRAPAGSLLEVASALCGARAQLPSTAELALWARIDDLEQGVVKRALEENRTLVKTWIRGTLHLLPADDLALYVAVLRPHPDGPGDGWLRLRGVTRGQYEAIVKNVPRALDEQPRTREWLADRLAELAGPDVREAVLFSWGGVLKQSARLGDLCFGPPQGRNVTFVRPDLWLRRTLRADPDEAGRDLVRRFLAAYGPASAVDFGRWIEDPGKAKSLLLASADELAEVEVEGRPAWALASDLAILKDSESPRGVRLLPAFDQYVTGPRPREAFVPSDHMSRVYRQQGWVSPVVLVDGRAAGIWSYERHGNVIRTEVEPFQHLSSKVQTALVAEVERLAAFLGGSPELSLTA
jgi:winged helix DNA-binding protein